MLTSLFLAKVLGLYFLLFGLFVLLRHQSLETTLRDVLGQRSVIFVIALITLILGILLVVSHNIWVMDWRLIITIFAWLIFLGGIFRLFFLDMSIRAGRWMLADRHHYILYAIAILFVLLGIYLLYKGYRF